MLIHFKLRYIHFLLTLIPFFFFSCTGQNQKAADKELLVLCGSANKPAIENLAELYYQKKNIRINLIFGGSGTVLSQMELSHKGDIYLPGSNDYMAKAQKKGLIIPESTRTIAYLVPAIITEPQNKQNIHTLEDLGKPGLKIGLANPESVCLGLYSIELLEHNGLLNDIMNNVVTLAGSCSKTANLITLTKVDAIIGWRVFHYWNKERLKLIPINKKNIPRIAYIPISISKFTKNRIIARNFIEFVISPTGKKIYRQWGYLTNKDEVRQFADNARIGGNYNLSGKYLTLIKK